jgi:hypothetical protein
MQISVLEKAEDSQEQAVIDVRPEEFPPTTLYEIARVPKEKQQNFQVSNLHETDVRAHIVCMHAFI